MATNLKKLRALLLDRVPAWCSDVVHDMVKMHDVLAAHGGAAGES